MGISTVSTRAVCRALGIELEEIPDWVCCGSTPAHASSDSLAVALPVLNLQKAQAAGLPVMIACASCYARLRTANHQVCNEPEDRRRTERITGQPYDGGVEVRHVLDVLVNHLGLDEIRAKVRRPLAGLRVACYYGCLLTRPPEIVAFDDAEHPTCMDDLVAAAGAEPVEWPFKTECCGASLSMTHSGVVSRLAHKLLSMAQKAGAECLVVACPLCQVNLDLRQADAAKAHGAFRPTPVLYVTQLLGLALGLPPENLGLDALTVDAKVAVRGARCRRGRLRRREIMTLPESKSPPTPTSVNGNGGTPCGSVLVCGGGIAGIQASLDLSAAGFRVFLVEESPTIGGGMARLDKTFPTGDCATCIISPKLVECMRDYNIDVLTMADVTSLDGEAGHFMAEVRTRPRGVIAAKCTGCGDCWTICPVRNTAEPPPPFQPGKPLGGSRRRQARRDSRPPRRRSRQHPARPAGDQPELRLSPAPRPGASGLPVGTAAGRDPPRGQLLRPVPLRADRPPRGRGLRGHVVPRPRIEDAAGTAGEGDRHRGRRDRQVGAIHAADGPLPRPVRVVAGHEDRRPAASAGSTSTGFRKSWSNSHERRSYATSPTSTGPRPPGWRRCTPSG